MKNSKYMFGLLLLVALFSDRALGQVVQRTFVSGSGSDSNPCSRTAPCRGFAQAISLTNAGGEVIVLDSAGYGAFSIVKSVSIISPPGVYAGISVFSGNGIDINAGPSDTVILRGLTVNNQGGTNGIVFNTGLKLHVEGCVINGFSNFDGLSLLAGGGAHVAVIDSIMRGNFFGIDVQPSSGTEQVTIDHVRLEANSGDGLIVRDGSLVTLTNSVAANNGNAGLEAVSSTSASVQMNVEGTVLFENPTGIGAFTSGTGAVQVNVARCLISSSASFGIEVGSTSTGVATVRLSSSTVSGNHTGLFNLGSPALLLSRGDNTVEGNTFNTGGTIGSYTPK